MTAWDPVRLEPYVYDRTIHVASRLRRRRRARLRRWWHELLDLVVQGVLYLLMVCAIALVLGIALFGVWVLDRALRLVLE